MRTYDAIRADSKVEEAWAMTIRVASIDDLIRMKRAAGRAKDKLMAEELIAIAEDQRRAAKGETPVLVGGGAGAGDGLRVAGVQDLAAGFADAAVGDGAAAVLVDDGSGGPSGPRGVAVAPVHQGDEGGPEVEALLGEEVFVAGRAFLVGAALEDVLVDRGAGGGPRGRCGRRRGSPWMPEKRRLPFITSRTIRSDQRSPITSSDLASEQPGPDSRDQARVIFAHIGCITKPTRLGSPTSELHEETKARRTGGKDHVPTRDRRNRGRGPRPADLDQQDEITADLTTGAASRVARHRRPIRQGRR